MNAIEQVQEVMSRQRMMSLGNLAYQLGCAWNALLPTVRMLHQQSQLRIANSSCSTTCAACAGCTNEQQSTEPELSERSIIIARLFEGNLG